MLITIKTFIFPFFLIENFIPKSDFFKTFSRSFLEVNLIPKFVVLPLGHISSWSTFSSADYDHDIYFFGIYSFITVD